MYDLMLKFSAQQLFEEFANQYIIEFGYSKFEKVAEIVKSSDNIRTYVDNVIDNFSVPNTENLQYVINSHSFFLWSKEETVCLGAMSIILMWSDSNYEIYNKEQSMMETKMMAKLIDKCSRLKYNQFNSFFDRFYRRLRLKEIK